MLSYPGQPVMDGQGWRPDEAALHTPATSKEDHGPPKEMVRDDGSKTTDSGATASWQPQRCITQSDQSSSGTGEAGGLDPDGHRSSYDHRSSYGHPDGHRSSYDPEEVTRGKQTSRLHSELQRLQAEGPAHLSVTGQPLSSAPTSVPPLSERPPAGGIGLEGQGGGTADHEESVMLDALLEEVRHTAGEY